MVQRVFKNDSVGGNKINEKRERGSERKGGEGDRAVEKSARGTGVDNLTSDVKRL